MDKLETVFEIGSDSFYDIDEKEKKEEYEEIKQLTKAQKAEIYLKSILYKIDFKDVVYEDLENYYYICNKCQMIVYYFEKSHHIASHIEDKSCCECVIV